MTLFFARYSTRIADAVICCREDFLDDLSDYVAAHSRTDGVKYLLIGLIFVEGDRAHEPLFQPRRNRFITYRSSIGPLGQPHLIEDALVWELQILAEDLLAAGTAFNQASFLVDALIHSFERVNPFVRRKKLRIDFLDVEAVLRAFIKEEAGAA